jgi:hypothetical protein
VPTSGKPDDLSIKHGDGCPSSDRRTPSDVPKTAHQRVTMSPRFTGVDRDTLGAVSAEFALSSALGHAPRRGGRGPRHPRDVRRVRLGSGIPHRDRRHDPPLRRAGPGAPAARRDGGLGHPARGGAGQAPARRHLLHEHPGSRGPQRGTVEAAGGGRARGLRPVRRRPASRADRFRASAAPAGRPGASAAAAGPPGCGGTGRARCS